MPDRPNTATWPRARVTALLLREELGARGVPDDILRQIVPTEDIAGRPMVRLGVWSVDDADRLLAALGSSRPALVGHRDRASDLPEATP